MIDAFGCAPDIPDINGEWSEEGFDGEDGGVTWVTDAPNGLGAVRFGQFGYVNNDQHALAVVTNYGTGILTWDWASSSESGADFLELWVDSDGNEGALPASWISGKEESWRSVYHVIKSGNEDRGTASKNLHHFLFEYSKDQDVSVFQDCAWLRQGLWTPTFKLTLNSGTIVSYTLPAAFDSMPEVIEEASEYHVFPIGTTLTIAADPAAEGKAFDSWEGDVFVLSSAVASFNTFVMPASDISLTATYVDVVTTSPSGSTSGLLAASAATITSLQIETDSTAQVRSLTEPDGALVTLEFSGTAQTDYQLEWTPSLSGAESSWQQLTILYREVLSDTSDENRQIKLYARTPSATPQGFFRLKSPE